MDWRIRAEDAGPNRAFGRWLGPFFSYAAPEKLLEMQKHIDEASMSVGRDPASIQRIYNIMGQIQNGPSADPFHGPVEQWVDELTGLVVEYGMDTFVPGLPEPPGDQIERFMTEVAPRVLENVAAQRA